MVRTGMRVEKVLQAVFPHNMSIARSSAASSLMRPLFIAKSVSSQSPTQRARAAASYPRTWPCMRLNTNDGTPSPLHLFPLRHLSFLHELRVQELAILPLDERQNADPRLPRLQQMRKQPERLFLLAC